MSGNAVNETAAVDPPLDLVGVIAHFNTLPAGRLLLGWISAGENPSARRAWEAYQRTLAIAWRQYTQDPHSWRAGRDADTRLLDLHISSLRYLMLGLSFQPGNRWRRLVLLDAMNTVTDLLYEEIEAIGDRPGPVTPGLAHTTGGGDAG